MSSHNMPPVSHLGAWVATERIIHEGMMPDCRETLLELVEPPLKTAVGLLYDKNIQTLGSSCNYQDFIRGRATVTLAADSLSGRNNTIASLYPHSQRDTVGVTRLKIIGLLIPIDPSDSPSDVGLKALGIAEQFEPQPFSWVQKWTIDEVRQHFKTKGEIDSTDVTDQTLIDTLVNDGYYYDPKCGLFFLSEEQCRKAAEATQPRLLTF